VAIAFSARAAAMYLAALLSFEQLKQCAKTAQAIGLTAGK
jgi:hypothetical protein